MIEFVGEIKEEEIEKIICLAEQGYEDEATNEVRKIADELENGIMNLLEDIILGSLK